MVPDRTRATLYPIIFDNIAAGTTIHSDSFTAYDTLGNYRGYIHLCVNHSVSFVEGDVNTQMIERRWGDAKQKVNKDGKTRSKNLQAKLDEYCVRRAFFRGERPYCFHKMGKILARFGPAARRYAAM